MADTLVPAGPNVPAVTFYAPDGNRSQQATVAAFNVTKDSAEPIYWPPCPKGWKVAISVGYEQVLLEDGTVTTTRGLMDQLQRKGGKRRIFG